MTLAAVVHAAGADPVVEAITLPEPGAGQVRVRLSATGVCHSDLSLARGTFLQQYPAVLGHEGAGHVVATGPDVQLREGDPVVLNWAPPCRTCWFCTHEQPYLCVHAGDSATSPYAQLASGEPLYAGLGVGAFAEETVLPAHACVRLDERLPLHQAALLGCAVLTGVGAVLNDARVQQGESVVVFGLGGVGLCAVEGARLAGASPIIAVDPAPQKEELGRRAGATEVLTPSPDLSKQVRALTEGRGADHAFECAGRADAIRAAWSATRRGGRVTVVGMGAKTDTVAFNALELPHFARTISGCFYGSSDPERDVPVLVEHVLAGRLDIDALVTSRVSLDGVAAAFADLEAGRGARSLIVFPD